ncbi:hypothetical protein PEC18_36255 [Paucibacter sp. O1-1]|uniref:hypothetical protein n=1 Tax=Paucibacter sp. XJ19-41 TaxID=2927824 RepID=UPI0021D4CA83|nr:hypothetical protein [Paucibacter sp. XJ19-41]MCU7376095.1 hypothetical protein [Paucibacter sp. O1-1]MDA3831107.1 hypothetical protein [Paucibacter sp. O1-1]MDC6167890.1 hypothetical protein [Paucibacter sp. XJ19-41]
MSPSTRKFLLFGLLAASAVAVAWDRLRASPPALAISGAVERPAPPSSAQPAQSPTSTGTSPSEIQTLRPRDDYQRPGADVFPATVAPVPQPPQTQLPPVEPPKPVAPALPFTVIGKKFERGQWEVYLAKGEQNFIATVGQRLSDDYLVRAITATQMTLVYVPLNEQQTLQIGAGFHD